MRRELGPEARCGRGGRWRRGIARRPRPRRSGMLGSELRCRAPSRFPRRRGLGEPFERAAREVADPGSGSPPPGARAAPRRRGRVRRSRRLLRDGDRIVVVAGPLRGSPRPVGELDARPSPLDAPGARLGDRRFDQREASASRPRRARAGSRVRRKTRVPVAAGTVRPPRSPRRRVRSRPARRARASDREVDREAASAPTCRARRELAPDSVPGLVVPEQDPGAPSSATPSGSCPPPDPGPRPAADALSGGTAAWSPSVMSVVRRRGAGRRAAALASEAAWRRDLRDLDEVSRRRETSREERRALRVEIRLAREAGVEALERRAAASSSWARRPPGPRRSDGPRRRSARARWSRPGFRPRRRRPVRAPRRMLRPGGSPGQHQRAFARRVGSAVRATERCRNAAAAASPPRACARSADSSSVGRDLLAGPGRRAARCHARRSGSVVGVGHRGERAVNPAAILRRGGAIDRRADQRMSERTRSRASAGRHLARGAGGHARPSARPRAGAAADRREALRPRRGSAAASRRGRRAAGRRSSARSPLGSG